MCLNSSKHTHKMCAIVYHLCIDKSLKIIKRSKEKPKWNRIFPHYKTKRAGHRNKGRELPWPERPTCSYLCPSPSPSHPYPSELQGGGLPSMLCHIAPLLFSQRKRFTLQEQTSSSYPGTEVLSVKKT
jgi:hypothetical protein